MARSRKQQPDPSAKHFADSNGEVQPRFVDQNGFPVDPSLFERTAPLLDDGGSGADSAADENEADEIGADVDQADDDSLPAIMPSALEPLGEHPTHHTHTPADGSTPLPDMLSRTVDAAGQQKTLSSTSGRASSLASLGKAARKLAPVLQILAARAADPDVETALAGVNVATDRVKIVRLDEELSEIAASKPLPITVGGHCLWRFCNRQFPGAAFFALVFERDNREILRVSLPRDEAGVQGSEPRVQRDGQREYLLSRNPQPEIQRERTGLEDVPAPMLVMMQQMQAQTQLLTELVSRQNAPREPDQATLLGQKLMQSTVDLVGKALGDAVEKRVTTHLSGQEAPKTTMDLAKALIQQKADADAALATLGIKATAPEPTLAQEMGELAQVISLFNGGGGSGGLAAMLPAPARGLTSAGADASAAAGDQAAIASGANLLAAAAELGRTGT